MLSYIYTNSSLKYCTDVFRFQSSDGEVKYLRDAEELIRPERNTLIVSFEDLEQFNQQLGTTIQEEFYRYEYSFYLKKLFSITVMVAVWVQGHKEGMD